jgi:hypothetical protein
VPLIFVDLVQNLPGGSRLRIWGLEVRVVPGAPVLALVANAFRAFGPFADGPLYKPSHAILADQEVANTVVLVNPDHENGLAHQRMNG